MADTAQQRYDEAIECLGETARDLARAKEQIVALRLRAEKAEALADRAKDILGRLVDVQNGCPLPKYEADWAQAMADADELLHGKDTP